MIRWSQYLTFGTTLLLSSSLFGATYYLSPTGSDSNNGQSQTAAWKSFSKAYSSLSAGDTLIVSDGSYSSASPPSGKAGTATSVITIKAQNDGQATLTGGMQFRNNSYLEYQGFKITGSSSSVYLQSQGTGAVSHHITFRRIGFSCSTTKGDDSCVVIADGSHHMLFEDFWIWGGGRYSLLAYGGPGGSPPNTTADNNTFRRGVIRQGPHSSSSGNPQAGIAMYYASGNVLENVIVLDSTPASDSSNSAFYITAHAPPPNATANKYYGVVSLNNLGQGFYLDIDNGSNASNTEVRNSVFWGSAQSGLSLYASGTCTGTIIDHITTGSNKSDGLWNYCSGTTVRSSVFLNNGGYGLNQGGQGSSTSNYNDFYGNSSGPRNNVSAGSRDITTNPQLKYLLRTETGTPCKGAGESSTDCGATIMNRYQNGVLTSTALWPWPNEARIKKDMCTDAGVTKGFCSKSSLTDYIWSYLGSATPSDLTGGGGVQISNCDLNSDGTVSSADVDLAKNQALGVSPCTNGDLEGNGTCTVVDVQRVINASMGQSCRTGT